MKTKRPFLNGLLIVVLAIVIGIVLANIFGIVTILISIPLILLITFLVLYFIWAPNNCFACFPEEGYCTIIAEGDSFYDAIIKYKGRILKKDYSIVPSDDPDIINHKKKPHLFFGMYIIPGWPLRKVFKKEVKWTKLGKEGKEDRSEILDKFLLMRYLYYVDVSNAETTNKVPINIGLNIEAFPINVYNSIFNTKSFPLIMNSKIESAVRNFVRFKSYEDIINCDLEVEILKSIDEVIKDMENIYGVEISKLLVINVEPADERYARATLDEVVQDRENKGIIKRAEGIAKAKSIESTGVILAMVLEELNIPTEDLPEYRINHSEEFRESYKRNKELYELLEKLKSNALIEIVSSGGGSSGSKNDIIPTIVATTIATNKILNNGNNGNGNNPSKNNDCDVEDGVGFLDRSIQKFGKI